MREMISYQEALEIITGTASRMEKETAPCENVIGRVLAESVEADEDVPPFDNSAMDGFAVIHRDLKITPATLDVIGEIQAGVPPSTPLSPGSCIRIMTGAPVPDGTTAVVPVEWTTTENDSIIVSKQPEMGQHIRRAGEDIRKGDVVIDEGKVVTPPVIGLLAIAGRSSVAVYRKPRVAIIATGDEIVEPGTPLAPGKIRNSNGPTLAAQVSTSGGQPFGPLVARDTRHDVDKTLDKAMEADVLVFAGGVSVGEYDFVQEALEKRGLQTRFWRVRQRPGKPLLFGTLEGKPVFGLPGNPVSASVCFEVYVRPLLGIMTGRADPSPASFHARLAHRIEKKEGLHYFARAVTTMNDGHIQVSMAGPQASNIFSTMERANCLAHLPENRDALEAGEMVLVSPLPWIR